MFFQFITTLLLIPASLICAYYWFLAFYILVRKHDKQFLNDSPLNTFAIVIPAHNEEDVILKTLQSCAKLNYPKELYKVFVIADNCTDQTCKIAIENDAVCLERQNKELKGKGFALAWAFEKILSEGYDALIVHDADCFLDSHALMVFDHYLNCGEKVLQANYVVSNPDDSPMSYAIAVGQLAENELFYSPKSQLGLAVFLQGTGMVFHNSILQKFPWDAHSIVEDVEYSLNLLRNDIPIKFVDEVGVMSDFPVIQKQLNVQRTRWAGGNLNLGKSHALKLILEGLHKRKARLFDAGLTFLVLSRPLILFELLFTLIFAFLSFWFSPGLFSNILLGSGIIVFLLHLLYFGLSIKRLGISFRRLIFLFKSPFIIAKLIIISFSSLIGMDKDIWARTPR